MTRRPSHFRDRRTPIWHTEHDGPLVRLHFTVSVAGSNLQFSPNGTAQQLVGKVSQAISTPMTVTVTKDSQSSTVTINGLGKIEIQ